MWWYSATALALASAGLFSSVSGQVITVTEYPSTCSAVYTSGSQTVTVIQSTVTVSPTATPLNDAEANSGSPFVIAVDNGGLSSRKRQATRGWIAENGNVTTDATQAAVFTINNGSLSSGAGMISTSKGVNNKVFLGASGVGNISTTFSINNGSLRWANAAFDGGVASFYKTPVDLIENAEVIIRFAGAILDSWASVLLTAESRLSALAVGSANATQSTSVATNVIVSSTSITAGASGSTSGMVGVTTTNSNGATIVTGPSGASTMSSGTPASLLSSTSALPTVSTAGQPIGPSHISIVGNVSSSASPVLSTSGSVTWTFTPTPSVSSSSSVSPLLSVSGSLTYTLSSSTMSNNSMSPSTSTSASSSASSTGSSSGKTSSSSSTVSLSSSTSAKASNSSTATSSSTVTPTAISTSGECGASYGQTCKGSIFGECCSAYGFCGNGTDYCAVSSGCQSQYGTCSNTTSSTTTSATPTSAPYESTTTITATSTSTTTTSVLVTSTSSRASSSYLTLPTPTACDFGDPSDIDQDDSFCTIDLPFTMNIYAKSDTHVYASTNGYLSILNGSQQYQTTTFPDSHIPNNTIAPLFEDLYLYSNATPAQGIFYQFDSSGVNGTFEYYIGSASGGKDAAAYHFTVAYSAARAGVFNITYYNVPDSGANAAVAMQGVNSAGTEVADTYSYRQSIITANLTLTCDTTSGSGSIVKTS